MAFPLKAGALLLLAGCAAPTGPAGADTVTIAALGDSLTAGYGLPPEQGFVPQMEAWLEARGHDVDIVNAGVSGDTTQGGLSRLAWTLTEEVDAVSVALGGNDFLRGIDPARSKENLDGILEGIEAAGLPALLIGLVSSPNYGPAWKASFDAMYPALAEQHGALYAPRFFGALVAAGGGGAPAQLRPYMQPDGIHPNADGVKLIVEALGPFYEQLIERAKDGAGS